jgi:hypothetical protein
LWFAKCCIEQYDALHATIKTNALLWVNVYQAPICKITPEICKFNMHQTIKKRKEQKEGRDVPHMPLIEPSGFIEGFGIQHS